MVFFFFLRILNIFNTHTHGERGKCFLFKKLTVVDKRFGVQSSPTHKN